LITFTIERIYNSVKSGKKILINKTESPGNKNFYESLVKAFLLFNLQKIVYHFINFVKYFKLFRNSDLMVFASTPEQDMVLIVDEGDGDFSGLQQVSDEEQLGEIFKTDVMWCDITWISYRVFSFGMWCKYCQSSRCYNCIDSWSNCDCISWGIAYSDTHIPIINRIILIDKSILFY